MEWLLAQAVSGWDVVRQLCEWALSNPDAAAFWGVILTVVIDWAVVKSPWGWDDMLWGVAKRAVTDGLTKALSKTKKDV